jgi:hypothetical protein
MRLEGKTAIVTGGGSGFGAGHRAHLRAGGRDGHGRRHQCRGRAGIAAEIGGIAQAGRCLRRRLGRGDGGGGADAWGRDRHPREQCGHHSSARAHGGGQRRGFRPRPRREREVRLPDRAGDRAVDEGSGHGGDPQHRLHRRAKPAAPAQLVQRLQGLDDHRDEDDGRGACARRASASTRSARSRGRRRS